MGLKSTATKNKWNEKTYDRFTLRFRKGEKQRISDFAQSRDQSLNAYILELIYNDMNEPVK